MADNNICIDLEVNDKNTKETLDSIIGSATKLVGPLVKVAAAAAAAAAAIAAVVIKESIQAASEYESVVNQLNLALASSGQFSKEAAEGFREFASNLQNTTKFSDDQVLSTAELIQNLAKLSNDGLKEATQATLNLSSALRIDLDTAATLVGKAANGNISAFQRYGIEIRKGTTDSETFANTLKTLSNSFPNAAEAAAKTFSGATAQLKNAFDDIFKEIGKAFAQSPALIAAIGQFKKLFSSVADFIKKTLGNEDILKPFLSNLVTVVAFITATLGPVIESFARIGIASFNSLKTALLTIITSFIGVGAVIEKITNALGVTNSTFFADATSESFNKLTMSATETGDSFVSIFSESGTATKAALDGLASLQGAIDTTSGKLLDLDSGIKNIPTSFELVTIGMSDLNTAFSEGLWPTFDTTTLKAKDLALKSQETKDSMLKSFKQIGESARQGIGQAVGGGFAAFGKALASGENAVKAFAKAFLGAIGGMLVQLGTSYILQGIAASANPLTPGIGGPLIAAGAALAAFGGILQAASGGGAGGAESSGGGVASGGGTGGDSLTPTPAQTDQELIRDKTQVSVNIQGNVLDRRETGLEIVQILNEAFDTQGRAVLT